MCIIVYQQGNILSRDALFVLSFWVPNKISTCNKQTQFLRFIVLLFTLISKTLYQLI